MSKFSTPFIFNIETPALYRIRVKGPVDPTLSDVLGSMFVDTESEGNEMVTALVGNVADQAALAGILKAIYDLRIPLLSVENLDEKLA